MLFYFIAPKTKSKSGVLKKKQNIIHVAAHHFAHLGFEGTTKPQILSMNPA